MTLWEEGDGPGALTLFKNLQLVRFAAEMLRSWMTKQEKGEGSPLEAFHFSSFLSRYICI